VLFIGLGSGYGHGKDFVLATPPWRDLIEKQNCVLEEPERFSVWGKIHLQQLSNDTARNGKLDLEPSLSLPTTLFYIVGDVLLLIIATMLLLAFGADVLLSLGE